MAVWHADTSGASNPPADSTSTGSSRRAFPRVPADRLSTIAVRVGNGATVQLVDLSRGGARLHTDRRMLPGSTVALKLDAADASFVVSGRVVRSRVIRLAEGGLGYEVALSFSETLHQLAELPDTALETQTAPTVTSAASSEQTVADPTTADLDEPMPAVRRSAEDERSPLPDHRSPMSMVLPSTEMLPEIALSDAPADDDQTGPASMIHVSATIAQTSDELIDLFARSEW